jgi:hypothetical protein
MEGSLAELPLLLKLAGGSWSAPLAYARGSDTAPRPTPLAPPPFDAIVGYNALLDEADKAVTRWQQAEESIYADPSDPLVNWDENDLQAALTAAGLIVTAQGETEHAPTPITAAMISRWFTPMVTGKPAYIDRLAVTLAKSEIERIRQLFERQLTGQPVLWQTYTVFVVARFAQSSS